MRGSESSFVSRVQTRLDDIEGDEHTAHIVPRVPPSYSDIQRQLLRDSLVGRKEEINVFYGGPLDLTPAGIDDAWVYPAEVINGDVQCNFHVIAINCEQGENLSDAPASLHFVSEPSLKLGIDSSATRNFSQHFVTNAHQRQVLIRPSLTGSNAYPLISTPLDSGQTTRNIVRGAKSLCRWLGTSELTYNTKINNLARSGEPSLRAEFGDYFLLEPIAMRMPSLGPVQLNKIYAPSSPWQYFEIYSFGDLLKMRNGQQITMRVDSGCDSGMLYHDYGCDCHAQLISALTWAQQDNGFVLHCPTQDGRGYGMNTKMETEAHKLGVPNVFNAGMPPMKTLEAAKRMLGDDHYDIRTFDGIGQMLGTMGFRNLRMITDNKHKVDQVSSGHRDLQVIRVRTGTSDQQAHCQHHVEEKRMSEDYYTV